MRIRSTASLPGRWMRASTLMMHREQIRHRSVALCLTGLCLAGLCLTGTIGCQISRKGTGAQPSLEVAQSYESRARFTSKAKIRTKHLNEAADIYIQLGRHAEAKSCLDRARESYYAGTEASRTNRLLGALYMGMGDAVLAERYLLKGLEPSPRRDRQTSLARLAVCARAQKDGDRARGYERRLSSPRSDEVQSILGRSMAYEPRAIQNSTIESLRERDQPAVRHPVVASSKSKKHASHPAIKLTTHRRGQWGARPAVRSRTKPMNKPRRITIHHTAGDSFWGRSKTDVADHLNKIQRHHQKNRGWADLGYHWLIDRNGHIWQGRELKYQGAHAKDHNAGNIGIALIGNYSRQKMTSEQKSSLAQFVDYLSRRYGIAPTSVHTHGELAHGSTACPGSEIQHYTAAVRWRLKNRNAIAAR